MHGFGIKKLFACILVAGATAAVWYGASHFRFSPEEIAAAEAAGNMADAIRQEETAEEEEDLPPLPEPAPEDTEGRLMAGDFTVLTNEPANTLQMLESVYGDVRARSRYLRRDVTGDGEPELLWVTGTEDTKAEAVIAVFAKEGNAARMILWDPETVDDYYAAGAAGLVYIRKNEWIISEFHCTNVLFDREYDLYAGDGIFLYIVADETAYREEVDAALRRRMEDVDGKGVWYYALGTGQEIEQAERIDASDWLDRFHVMTGSTLLYASPSIEEIRSGVEAGVARKSYMVRRARVTGEAYEEAVYYPQMTEGDKRASVNNVLRDAAFDALMQGYTDVKPGETAEDYLQRMKADKKVSRTAESSFRLVSDTDALLSVLYRTRRGADGVFDKTEISFLTIDKQTGRQLQIGDLTNADTIARAVANGDAELFYASGDDVVFERDENPAHDVNWMSDVFSYTRSAGDVWKKAGLDEQFLFIVVITDRETGSEAILRIPRWKVGMSTTGHMELLTWHEAYPYLQKTLDMATSLTVRKNPGGFMIAYRTDEGGRVTLDLRDSTRLLPESHVSPEESRDYFSGAFPDMTAFAVGTFDGGDFYAVEQGRGAEGYIYLRVGENTYVITQNCVNTRGGVMPIRQGTSAAAALHTTGSLYTDSFGAGTWHNYETGTLTLTRRITLEDLYAFTLIPSPGSAGKEQFGMLEIGPVGGEAEHFPLFGTEGPYVFRDINADGYADFTVGQIREEDHGDEHNFFYLPGPGRFVEGPDILQGSQPYSFDAETGYALVGDPETEVTLYAFDADGVFRALRRQTRTQTADGTHLVVRTVADPAGEDMTGGEGPAETVLLEDTLSGEALDEADILFRSEIVWQGTLHAAETGTVIVTKRNASDIILPLETVRIYMLDGEGRFKGCKMLDPTEDRLLYAEAEETDPEGNLTQDSTLRLGFKKTAEEEEEQVVSVTVRELLEGQQP